MAPLKVRLVRGVIPSLLAINTLLSACGTVEPGAPPRGVAPLPVQYTCAQEARLLAEYQATAPGSMMRRIVEDYRIERRALRAYHNQPLDGKCTPP